MASGYPCGDFLASEGAPFLCCRCGTAKAYHARARSAEPGTFEAAQYRARTIERDITTQRSRDEFFRARCAAVPGPEFVRAMQQLWGRLDWREGMVPPPLVVAGFGENWLDLQRS